MKTRSSTKTNPSKTILPIFVEVHNPPRAALGSDQFVYYMPAEYIKHISWSDSVSPPYGGCSIKLSFPRSTLLDQTLLKPGQWIVIRKHEDGPALFFGHISRVTGGIQGGPAIKSMGIQVEAENWYQFLQRAQMYVFPGLGKDADRAQRSNTNLGTLFDVGSWVQMFSALEGLGTSGSEVDKKPGEILARMLRILARVLLPGSLTGGTSSFMSRNINVVYDEKTADETIGKPKDPDGHEYKKHSGSASSRVGAAKRIVDPLIGFSINSLQSVNPVSGTSVLDFLNGTFQADSYMMEMFPSLEDFGAGPELGVTQNDRSSDLSDRELEADLRKIADALYGGDIEAARADTGGDDTLLPIINLTLADLPSPLAKYLKKNACLIYRMRPWRTEPVWVYANNRASRFFSAKVTDPVDRKASKEVFTKTTWKPSEGVVVPADQVISMSYSREDVQRANVVTTSMPFSGNQALAFDELGLPVYSITDVHDQGARFMNVNWPFFLMPDRDISEKTDGEFLAYLRAVVYQSYMWTYNNDRFMNGTVTMAYRPDIRHGEVFWFGVGPGIVSTDMIYPDGRPQEHAAQCPADALAETPKKEDNGKAPFDAENDYICAYADTVSHSFEAMPNGQVKMRTTVTFQRGLFNNIGRTSPCYFEHLKRWGSVMP